MSFYRSNRINCDKKMKWIQFTNISGSKTNFEGVFCECVDYCNRKFNTP